MVAQPWRVLLGTPSIIEPVDRRLCICTAWEKIYESSKCINVGHDVHNNKQAYNVQLWLHLLWFYTFHVSWNILLFQKIDLQNSRPKY